MTPLVSKEKILSKAKIGLMAHGSIFLCTIAFSLRYSWDSSIPTAGVDGVTIHINPDWFCGLEPEERIGLLAHESWHVALDHIGETGRRQGRNKEIYNDAGDYVINLLVTSCGMKIPPNGLLDIKYRDWSTNQVYDDLMKNTKTIKVPSGSLSRDIMPSPLSDSGNAASVKQMLVKASIQARMGGESPGDLPMDLQRKLDDILNPKLPWETLLDRFLTDMAPDDYSWRRPNKRFMPQHILPSRHSKALGHIIIAIDTSGSVTDKQMQKILSEITYIKTKFDPKKMTILDCDTKIHNIYEITSNDQIQDLSFKGYGGTRVAPPIEYAKAHNAQALLYFTDGGFTPYIQKVPFPLLWIIYNNPNWTAPVGEVIIYGD